MEHHSNGSIITRRLVHQPSCPERGRKIIYTTVGSLVDRSGYFAEFFSGRWPIQKQEDGSIYVDADPKVFAHILSYLRHGIFPICYDAKTSHDHKLYAEILVEAKYYQVPKLEVWLTNRCYSKAVDLRTITSSTGTWEGRGDQIVETFTGGEMVSFDRAESIVEQRYQCRNAVLDKHRLRRFCGNYCMEKNIPEQCLTSEVQLTMWLQTVRKISVQEGWCSDSRKDFDDYWRGLVGHKA